MQFFTTEKISKNVEKTPEGFLLATGVPVARTGLQLYAAEEIPNVQPGADGIIYVDRRPEDVFRPETLASFNGKPFTNDHPESEGNEWAVRPDNYSEVGAGTVLNPRRGTGIEDGLLLCDIVIMREDAIADYENGKREVSVGYDCEYIETAPGHAYQTNIVANHVALVDKARCGSQCSIRDRQPEEKKMKKTFLEKVRCAFKAKDEKAFEEVLSQAPAAVHAMTIDEEPSGGGTVQHFHLGTGGSEPAANDKRKYSDEALDAKFGEIDKKMGDNHKAVMDSLKAITDKMPKDESEEEKEKKEKEAKEKDAESREIEGELEEEAPAGTGDKARKAKDSAYLQDSFQETVAIAEVIAPGIHIPTFDRAAAPRKTYDDVCGLRRKALQLGNNDPATNGMILSVRGGKELTNDSLAKLPCSQVRTLFFSVGTMKQKANNDSIRSRGTAAGNGDRTIAPTTLKEVNERNAKFYQTHQ